MFRDLPGRLLAPVPLPLLQPLMTRLVRRATGQRPELFRRLGSQKDKRYLIDPVNMPFVFLLCPDPARPSLRLYRRSVDLPLYDARIAGTFLTLLDMVDGKTDGDALFFSRDLIIEGDTEAVVVLRNALDDLDGRITDDLAAFFGPPGRMALSMLRKISSARGEFVMPPSDLTRPELVCPAGTPAALRTAVDAGADAVYCGFQNATNARNFPGLNFMPDEMEDGIAYAHAHGAKVLLAANTFPPAGQTDLWKRTVDMASDFGVDAIIVADIGVASYAAQAHPNVRLHLSVQGGASSPEAIKFYCQAFNIKRVVLPRLLTVEEIKSLHDDIPCEIEAFVFGNIGMMAEGRCALSSYATGVSTNMDGVCSPASAVRYIEDPQRNMTAKLGDFTIDRFSCGQSAGYPTICKGRYLTPDREDPYYAFEEPVSLNLTALLPDLMRAGVTALKIEGRQRSRAYVQAVVSSFRKAIDALMEGQDPALADLMALTEGRRETQGAFAGKRWR